MAPKKPTKGDNKSKDEKGSAGKLKPATAINTRHILVLQFAQMTKM